MSGVEKGIAQGGKPIEVMGLMLGRPCTENERTLIVTDVKTDSMNKCEETTLQLISCIHVMQCFPIPVEGFETRVVADDEDVTNYMIELSEMLELVCC